MNRRKLHRFKIAFWVSSVLITIFFIFFQIKRDDESVIEAFIFAPLLTMMLIATFVLAGFALVAVLQLGVAIKEQVETFWNWLTR